MEFSGTVWISSLRIAGSLTTIKILSFHKIRGIFGRYFLVHEGKPEIHASI